MTMDNHAARKAAVYEAALQLVARGVSPAAWLNTALPGKSSASASCLPTAARWPGWRSGRWPICRTLPPTGWAIIR